MNTCSYIHIMRDEESVSLLKLLADPTRYKIICLLLEAKGKELCVKDISQAVKISHSATSHQLAKLEAHGIVQSERYGQTICYCLAKNKLTKRLRNIIMQIEA